MLSDLKVRKMNLFFKWYDVDGNGFIEKSDIEKIGKGYGETLNLAPDSPELISVIERELVVWETLRERCDVDGDGKISREEFIKGVESWMNDSESFEPYVTNYGEFVFQILDRDNDNKLDPEEYLAMTYAQDKEKGLEVFKRMDIDGSGYLTKDELLKHWLDFFYSDDPDAAGNFIWGKID